MVWGPEGPGTLAWLRAVLQEWNVTCALSHRRSVPSSSGDCGSPFVISILLRHVHQGPSICVFLFLVGHPETPLWPALGLEAGMYASHSYPGSRIRVPATLPSRECCLLILSDSGNLHSRAAYQNTGQMNMSFDYPLMAAKDSINLIHK